jgi:hypothetical protein
MGVKRRIIDLLASLGVTISYTLALTYGNKIGEIAVVRHIERLPYNKNGSGSVEEPRSGISS